MMAWDITFAEFGTFFGNGFLQIFGNPFLIGAFIVGMVFWWTKDVAATISSMFFLFAIGLLMLVNAGYLPSWMAFITLITVATLAGVVVMTRLT